MIESHDIVALSKKNINIALEFLIPHEYKCMSLVSHLLRHDSINSDTIYIVKKKGTQILIETIRGIFLLTNTGILLHFFLACSEEKKLKSILKRKYLFSLAGTEKSSSFFEFVFRNKSSLINIYHLMVYKPDCTNSIFLRKIDTEKFKIYKCNISDTEKLFNLQMAYQIEEVLPSGKNISDNACRKILIDRLKEQMVFAILDIESNKFVSMAGTNAIGVHFVQLGGIYTEKKFRNLGLAQYLVRHILSSINKNVSLFVRKDNLPAINAYTKSGFCILDTYKICYM